MVGPGPSLSDADLDGRLPPDLQAQAHRHWTPVAVTRLGVQWLEEVGVRSVLDLGSGAGKFCVAGACLTPLTFTGVEHRPHLVTAAQALATAFGVTDRVTFLEGDLARAESLSAEALYLYNPFGENLLAPSGHLDGAVELNRRRFQRETARMEAWLARRPRGSWLLTLNGFGGRIPDTYDLLRVRDTEVAPLRLWRRMGRPDQGGYWLELDDRTVHRDALGRETPVPADR
jgi:SAM-dependent methyltransferase